MTLTGSSASPFAAVESAIHKTLFAGHSPYAALTGEEAADRSGGRASDAARGPGPGPPAKGQTLRAKDESENPEPGSRKKTD